MRYFVSFIISLIIAAVIVQFTGDQLEEPVRTALYKLKGETVLAYSKVHLDSNGVPYVDYYELNGYTAGKQYNATIVCNYAIEYYNAYISNKEEQDRKRFFNCVQWLRNDITHKDNYALFVFRWRQPWYDSVGVPFTSGMTSGLGIQVFSYAYKLSQDTSYLTLARQLLRGYFVPIEQGGFTYQTQNGWWYEELADTAKHTPFILDGHIFAITGLHPYSQLTKDDSAAIATNKGIAALKHQLPFYDIGNGKIYYDKYKLIADKSYHKLLVRQMKQLHDITGDAVFLQYHKKWKAPLVKPYLLRIVQQHNISGIVLYLLLTLIVFALVIATRKLFRI